MTTPTPSQQPVEGEGTRENHVALSAEQSRGDRSSTAAHTPGPWKIEHRRDGDIDIVAPIGIFNNAGVARAFDLWDRDGGKPARDANAALIVAAPDLLAQLKIAARHIEHMAAWIATKNDGYSFE